MHVHPTAPGANVGRLLPVLAVGRDAPLLQLPTACQKQVNTLCDVLCLVLAVGEKNALQLFPPTSLSWLLAVLPKFQLGGMLKS
jgi:hypothetical protein